MRFLRFLLILFVVALLGVIAVTAQSGTPEATSASTATAPAKNADWKPVTQSIKGVDMVLVPAGTFTMGTSKTDVDALVADCQKALGQSNCPYEWYGRETPQGQVTFAKPYWISRTEVTNAQYAKCVTAKACTPPSTTDQYADAKYANYPVVYVSWDQANQYADWVGGRLPTEAEWEYAARGVDSLVYPYGNQFDPKQLNFCDTSCPRDQRDTNDGDDGFPQLAPVGSYKDTSWVGAVDMSGNAAEWTLTMYNQNKYLYPYTTADGRNDRTSQALEARIVRGGSWEDVPRDTRAAFRRAIPYPMKGTESIGFRIVADYAP